MSAVRLGLVGCGRLAEAGYLPALSFVEHVTLAAVADPDAGRRELVARLAGDAGHRVSTHAAVDQLLAAGGVDAVVLANPVGAHASAAAAVVAAGLPVLVEKPPAPDVAGARELARLVPPPAVGFNRRFDPGISSLRQLVPVSGHVQLNIEIHYRRSTWRPVAVHDDAVLDLGPHAVDLARWLTGSEPVEVIGATVEPDEAEFHLLLDRARVRIRVATARPHHERYEVFDDRGRSLGRHRLGGLVAGVRGRLRPGPGPSALVGTLAGQLDAFASAVRGEPAPDLGTATDGVTVMRVLNAIRTSAAAGGRPAAVARTES